MSATVTTTEASGRFASLRIPVYRRLLLGGVFSFLAMMISTTARSWLAFDLEGSNTALGGILIGFGLASVLMIPIAGVLADRLPKRQVLLVTSGLQTTVSMLLATAAVTDVIAYWMLVVASIVQGAVISLLGPARLAFISESVDQDHLTNGVLLSQSSLQLTRVIGPAVAGALIGIEMIGVGGVYYIAAACALLGLVLTFGLPEGRPAHQPTRSPLADLQDGLRFVRSNPHILRLLILSYLVVLIGLPHVAFLPVLAEGIFSAGSTGFGLLTTASAVGALAASLALADVDQRRVFPLQAAAAVLFGVSLIGLAIAPVFAVALLVMLVVGATSAAFQALNNSLVLTSSPVEYHGRVQSLIMVGFTGFGLLALPFGIVADAIGLRETLFAMGVLVTVSSVAMLARRSRFQRPGPVL